MKNMKLLLGALILSGSAFAISDAERWDPRMAQKNAVVDAKGVKWIDGRDLPLEGKAYADVEQFYDRLPRNVTTNVNGGVRSMKHHSTGLQFRFKTSSPTISCEWVPTSPSLAMDHMPATGVSGIDIYVQDANGTWQYLKTGRFGRTPAHCCPTGHLDNVSIAPGTPICVNMPLYNGIRSFRLGIRKDATVSALGPRQSGVNEPVVFYGTSITHGGCCSRPGMAFASIVGRDLDVPIVNLGFSGSGKMEFEMSEHLAAIDASVYVLDCLWNMSDQMVYARYEPFIRNLRAKRPDVPIVMAEQCDVFCGPPNNKDKFMAKLYKKLIAEGWKKLVYLPKTNMYVGDREGTVDSCHPNDWGMMSMARAFGAAVREALGERLAPSPESLGVSSPGLLDWIDACERELDVMHGFVLLRHGKLVAQGSWAPYDTLNVPHMLFSHSKSFTSTAIGFLVDDGKLDLDARVAEIFPDKIPANPSENLKQLRVRDLLTMNLGASRTDAENNDPTGDWEKALLGNTIDHEPGTIFRYDSGATYLCSAIVERKSGKRTMDFLKERLFDKIGITKAFSTTSPSGTACGGWGMCMTTPELARFGQLLLQQGEWKGERILSAEWIALATARQTWSGKIGVTGEDGSDWHQGYGFQFWRCRHGCYRADGANGQYTIVMPQYDAVLSIHAGLGNMQKELDLVWKYVLPALRNKALPPNETAALKLTARCRDLKLKPLAGTLAGDEAFLNKTFRFEKVRHDISSIRLVVEGSGLAAELTTAAGVNRYPIACGDWARGGIAVDKGPYDPLGAMVGHGPLPVASSAAMEGGKLHVRTYFTTGPHRLDLVFEKTADGALVVKGGIAGIGGVKLSGRADK